MKKIYSLIISVFIVLGCLTSCIGTWACEPSLGLEPNVELIISNGVPFYNGSVLEYYLYNNIYYYPYWDNGHRYFRGFRQRMPMGYRYTPNHQIPFGPRGGHFSNPPMNRNSSTRITGPNRGGGFAPFIRGNQPNSGTRPNGGSRSFSTPNGGFSGSHPNSGNGHGMGGRR